MELDPDTGTVRMDWHHYSLDQVDTWADRIVEAAWSHGYEYVEFVHGAPDIGTRGSYRAGRIGARAAAPSRSCCAGGCSATAGIAGRGSGARGCTCVEEGRMLIALRENPRPGEAGEVAADPAARARLTSV